LFVNQFLAQSCCSIIIHCQSQIERESQFHHNPDQSFLAHLTSICNVIDCRITTIGQ
jgi:hypothetical protein